ncbi:H-NS histone [Burkholderia sp. Nafp2/4-1b]|uniref:H-NS histone family protein n=1 Tax=Burkholderia sp. Nafp2/4-1b TaxID=2116686 RepID=UPI000EF8A3B0|nr:H-NS histone [Burkholderia sp. Nafp2/4-1b]
MLIYKSFIEKKALLEAQLAREREAISAAVLNEVRNCIEEFGFTQNDLFPSRPRATARRRRAKYFNPDTGQTWSGVGREPVWMRGRDRTHFLIDAAENGSSIDESPELENC